MARKKKTVKETILSLIPKLSKYEFEEVAQFVELSHINFHLETLQKEAKEARYSEGQYTCPFCRDTHIVKNGTQKGVQRYLCRQCRKSFSDQTATPSYHSKKSPKLWLQYLKCMLSGYTIRKCAEECKINIATAFFWRHKILDALTTAIGVGDLEGLVEADETFFRYNRKGNFTKVRSYKKGIRTSTGRTTKQAKKKKRGLSRDQVAVGTALDRLGNLKIGLICTGRLQYPALKRFYEGHISANSTLCTDSAHGYATLSEELHLNHIRIESGKRKKDIYHIQHINSLHSRLKAFMSDFKGVATKHLQNYLYWFKFIELFKSERESIKIERAYVLSQAHYTDCSVKAIKTRTPCFCVIFNC